MAQQGKFKRSLSLIDLIFLGVGSTIGSGWLYGAMKGVQYAGSLAWVSWIIGAIIFIFIGLVYAELAAALPRSGGFLRYADFTHGSLTGYMVSVFAFLGYTSMIGVEAVAVRQYASYYWEALSTAAGNPTLLGFIIQSLVVVCFFLVNFWSVKFFGKTNTFITIFKFIVPILIVVIMFANMDFSNFSVGGAAPGGIHGIFEAVVGAGIAFAFLGFRQAVDFAGEAKNPQRDLPIAILLSITVCLILYVLLQIAFIGAVPADMLTHGWASIDWNSPWAKLAQTLGIIWLANIVLIDAVVSPAACGNAYFSGTARMMFAWAKNGYFYSIFAKIDKRTGLPRGALWLSLIMGIAWTLPDQFQTWGGLIGAVSSALVLTYLTGPVSAGALRKREPNLKRPFRLKGMQLIAPLSFASATLVAYWSGFNTLSLLIGLTIGSLILFFAFADKDEKIKKHLKEDFCSSIWLFVFFAFILVISYLGSFGMTNATGDHIHQVISGPWDSIIVAIGSIILYYFGVNGSLKKPRITVDEEEQQSEYDAMNA